MLLMAQGGNCFLLPARSFQTAAAPGGMAKQHKSVLARGGSDRHGRAVREAATFGLREPYRASHSCLQVLIEDQVASESVSIVASAAERADEHFAAAVMEYQEAAKMPATDAARDEHLIAGMRHLKKTFELDFEGVEASHYAAGGRGRTIANVTCMRPLGGEHDDSGFIMNDELLAMVSEGLVFRV